VLLSLYLSLSLSESPSILTDLWSFRDASEPNRTSFNRNHPQLKSVLHTTSPSTTIKEKLQALLYETTTATTPHHGMGERRAQESAAAAAAAMKLVLKMRREKERKTNEKVEAQRKKLAEQIKKFWPQWSSPDEESKAAEKIFRF
jgi:hypothetical protein